MSARSIIKLSIHQAEGRRAISTARCLMFLLFLSSLILIYKVQVFNHLYAVIGIVFLLALVYFRTNEKYKYFLISESYLHTKKESIKNKPGKIQIFGFGVFMTALRTAIFSSALAPSIMCIYEGAVSYSMSGMRIRLALMLGASFSLAISGIIFAMIMLTCLAGAEYIYFSGRRYSPFSASEYSMEIMYSVCGEYILLKFKTLFHTNKIGELCKYNFVKKRLSQCIDEDIKMGYNLNVYADVSMIGAKSVDSYSRSLMYFSGIYL